MFQGLNPHDMKRAMKQMGIRQEDIEASEVIIKTADREIVISNPQVSKVNMMGQEMFQVTGKATERAKEAFSEDDVKTVMEQAGADEDEAREALKDSNGDLAEAIIELKK